MLILLIMSKNILFILSFLFFAKIQFPLNYFVILPRKFSKICRKQF